MGNDSRHRNDSFVLMKKWFGRVVVQTNGMVQNAAVVLDKIKTIILGQTKVIIEKKKENFLNKLFSLSGFFVQHKMYSFIALISFLVFVFGGKLLNTDSNLFDLLSKTQTGFFNYAEKLFKTSVSELKFAYVQHNASIKEALDKIENQYKNEKLKSDGLEKENKILTKTSATCSAENTILAAQAQNALFGESTCLISLNDATTQLGVELKKNSNENMVGGGNQALPPGK